MDALEIFAVAEGGVAAGTVTAVAARFGVVRRRGRGDARRREGAHALLVPAVLGEGDPAGAAAELARAPVRQQVDLVAGLARTSGGAQRERLTAVAEGAGLVRCAEGWCASRLWWRRLRGARVLSFVSAGEAVVPALLDDPHPEVRAQAAAWAADWPRPGVIERLLDMLGDPENLCRFTVKDSLLRLGRPAVEPLGRRLGALDGLALQEALTVAAGLAEPRLLEPVLVACDHPRGEVRALAMNVAGRIGGPAAVDRALALLDDPVPDARAAAAHALGHLGHWPAGAALAERLRDPAWDVRRAAGVALRQMGAPGTLLLRRGLTDADRFAADMARQILDVPAVVSPQGLP